MPDSFALAKIADHLETQFVGRVLHYHARLASTMTVARTLARDNAPEGTLVLAEVQTAGLGRLARRWHTPGGNIALSLVLRPPEDKLPYLVMLVALAVTDTIEFTCGLACDIKWPNDVLLGGKKVAGILMQQELGTAPFTVVGIGINVSLDTTAFPDIREVATSLTATARGRVDRALLLKGLLEQIERRYVSLDAPQIVFNEWRRRLVTLGRVVTVNGLRAAFSGVAEDVAVDGGLLVRTPSGRLEHVLAADVTLV